MYRTLALPLALSVLFAACDRPQQAGTTTRPASAPLAALKSPSDADFKKQAQARLEEMQKEESINEEAPWIGKTGLDSETERRLPRYLRREFGVLLSEPNSLKARDLEYLGVFSEGAEKVRYWRINYGSPEPKFAYVVSGPGDRQFTGWGGRKPPPQ